MVRPASSRERGRSALMWKRPSRSSLSAKGSSLHAASISRIVCSATPTVVPSGVMASRMPRAKSAGASTVSCQPTP